jgi:hypothetical protein
MTGIVNKPTNSARSPISSPNHTMRSKNLFLLNRRQLVWFFFTSLFFCIFLGWDRTISPRAYNVNKAFQVNPKTNHTGVIRQISLIGERNSGTKWLWG